MRHRIALKLLAMGLALAPLSPAHAAVITNLSDRSQTVEIGSDDHFAPVVIAPGETWRMPGKIVARFKSREVHMEDNDEFAIWNGGDFGPQRRATQGAGGFPL